MDRFVREKQQLFIFEHREMSVLVMICVVASFSTFTLGIHLGKKLTVKSNESEWSKLAPVATQNDKVPSHEDLAEAGRTGEAFLTKALKQELQEEIHQTGLKLDHPRQVELPKKLKSATNELKAITKTVTAIATSKELSTHKEATKEPASEEIEKNDLYTLQIGSYPSQKEAENSVEAMNKAHLRPFLREAEIKGKGKWFRLYLGGYATHSEAETAGKNYQSQHKIHSFIVSRFPASH